jgi:hypothetical protein
MRRPHPHRPSRASLPWTITVIALILAMGGTGFAAAQRYIITQKNQIKPSVLRQLKGSKGPKGARGPAGAPGAAGAAGAAGAPGAAGSAKAYGQIAINGAILSIVGGVGLLPNGVRSPSVGIYCITAPVNGVTDQVVLVSPAGFIVGVVGQMGRTICAANEYQIYTTDTGGTLVGNLPFNILVP